jgi:hypothetical protein
MLKTGRMTKGTAASITFGLGSFILMADITVVVLRNGDEGGNIFEMGFPTVLGVAGILLWSIGIVLLVMHKIKRKQSSGGSGIRPIFLKGKKAISCPACRRRIDTSGITFHERYTCDCGIVLDIYQEPDDG